MKRGKKVLIGIFILGIMVSIGFIVGDEEGELPSLPADVSLEVAGAPAPPEIVYVSDIMDEISPGVTDRGLTGCAARAKEFQFYVYSAGGVAALPGDVGNPITNLNALITVRDKNAPNDERKSSDGGLAVTCSLAGDVASYDTSADDCTSTGNCIGPNIGVVPVRKYKCTVAMQHYDDFGADLSRNWEVRAKIIDDFTQEDSSTVPNSQIQPVRSTYFNELESWNLGPLASNSLNFGSVNYGPQLDRVPTTNYPLEVKNCGNKDVGRIDLRGFNVPDLTAPDDTDYIPAEWFTTGVYSTASPDPSPCRGDEIAEEVAVVHSTYIDTTLVSGASRLLKGTSGTPIPLKNLGICLNKIQLTHSGGSVSQQAYSTTGTGGTAWDIEVPVWLAP